MQQAAQQERARIARELHDVVGHALVAMKVQAGTALAIGTTEQHTAALTRIRDAGDDALREVRSLVQLLREDDGAAVTGDLGAIPQQLRTARQAGVDLHTDVTDFDLARWQTAWPAQTRLTVLRLVQEGLTNGIRHGGPAPHARLSVTCDDRVVRLRLRNDLPVGAQGPDGSGSGLLGLRERVALAGGELHAGVAGDAFQLTATIPLPEEAA